MREHRSWEPPNVRIFLLLYQASLAVELFDAAINIKKILNAIQWDPIGWSDGDLCSYMHCKLFVTTIKDNQNPVTLISLHCET